MDQSSHELRHAAADAFMQAIAQLETTLQLSDESAAPTATSPNVKQHPESAHPAFDLDALADAAADIEQFIQNQAESCESSRRRTGELERG